MATTEQLQRLDQFLDEMEANIRRAYLEFVANVKSETVMEQILERLEERDYAGAFRIVETHIARMANVLPAIAIAAGNITAEELAEVIPGRLEFAISFDPTHPRAAEMVADNRGRFIREFTESQRQSVSQAISASFRDGGTSLGTARAIRDSIGLTAYQEQIVRNYRRNLEELDRRALDRVLRDGRFDRAVAAAIERERPLPPKQIDRMVERYRQRWIAHRAETIARTEANSAAAAAREEAAKQMLEQTGIDPDDIDRIWNSTPDKRRRDWHASMEQQRRGIDEPFTDGLGNSLMRPGDRNAPAETILNCRCQVTYEVRRAA